MATVIWARVMEDHTEFKLSNKPELLCKIDNDDFEKFIKNSNSWYIHVSTKCVHKKSGYIRKTTGGKTLHLHREIVKAGDWSMNSEVDHKNHDTLDNRKLNLVEGTRQQNNQNKPCKNGRYRGCAIVFIPKRSIFQSYFHGDEKHVYMGSSRTLDGLKKKIDKKIEQTEAIAQFLKKESLI